MVPLSMAFSAPHEVSISISLLHFCIIITLAIEGCGVKLSLSIVDAVRSDLLAHLQRHTVEAAVEALVTSLDSARIRGPIPRKVWRSMRHRKDENEKGRNWRDMNAYEYRGRSTGAALSTGDMRSEGNKQTVWLIRHAARR